MFNILQQSHFYSLYLFFQKRGQRLKFCKEFMTSFKVGQVVKFLKPYPDEDPEQPYIVKEVKEGFEGTRIDISPLNLGLAFPSVYVVKSTELILVEQMLAKEDTN
jgi:hypothetical protein